MTKFAGSVQLYAVGPIGRPEHGESTHHDPPEQLRMLIRQRSQPAYVVIVT